MLGACPHPSHQPFVIHYVVPPAPPKPADVWKRFFLSLNCVGLSCDEEQGKSLVERAVIDDLSERLQTVREVLY